VAEHRHRLVGDYMFSDDRTDGPATQSALSGALQHSFKVFHFYSPSLNKAPKSDFAPCTQRATTGSFAKSVESSGSSPSQCAGALGRSRRRGYHWVAKGTGKIDTRHAPPSRRRIRCAQRIASRLSPLLSPLASNRHRYGIAASCAGIGRRDRPISCIQDRHPEARGTTWEEAGEATAAQAAQVSDAKGLRPLSQAQGTLYRRADTMP